MKGDAPTTSSRRGPVTRIEIEHEDGTVKVIEGEEADKWARYMDAGLALLVTRPYMAPEPPDGDAWVVSEGEHERE